MKLVRMEEGGRGKKDTAYEEIVVLSYNLMYFNKRSNFALEAWLKAYRKKGRVL